MKSWVGHLDSFGRPYVCYVPKKLAVLESSRVFEPSASRFSLIDHQLKAGSSQLGNAAPNESRLSLGAILKMNSSARGGDGDGIRTGMVWVGASTPADAWFVPPPASALKPLMKDLVFFINDSRLPATLVAAVALMQLVLIHPFSDGNGRTARLLFRAILERAWLLAPGDESWVSRIWGDRGMHLHRCSGSIRNGNNWNDWFDHCVASFSGPGQL